jgi:beta-N-acetylhexosaminidase
LIPAADKLSLREKIAQLVFVRIGSNMPPVRTVEQDHERVLRLVDECPVGGLLLFNGGPDTKKSLERLQAKSQTPLLVASDVERGVGQQVKGFTLFPHAAAFDKLGSKAPKAVAEFARSIAHEAREAGIHITFGPVADVNTNPRNPIINTRAFSEDAGRAAELTRAFVAAAEAAGLATTAKHFPGHGSTERDSHDSVVSVTRSRAELQACEFVPFEAAIDAGCSLVMTAHVSYPALDPSGAPATLSPAMLNGLLREEMGFRGVVCSDSLLMAGVRNLFPREEEMTLAVLQAGVDLLLDLEQPRSVIDYLCECVDAGRLDESRVDEAFERVRALKSRVFAKTENVEGAGARGSNLSAGALAERVAKEAIQIIGELRHGPLPFRIDAPVVAVLLKPFETAIEPPEQPLGAFLREQFRETTYIQLGPKTDDAAYDRARELARNAKQLLLAVIVRPAAWHAFGLRPVQVEFVRHVVSERKDVVLASLGVSHAITEFDTAGVRLCTFSDVPVSQRALVEFLLGGPKPVAQAKN